MLRCRRWAEGCATLYFAGQRASLPISDDVGRTDENTRGELRTWCGRLYPERDTARQGTGIHHCLLPGVHGRNSKVDQSFDGVGFPQTRQIPRVLQRGTDGKTKQGLIRLSKDTYHGSVVYHDVRTPWSARRFVNSERTGS